MDIFIEAIMRAIGSNIFISLYLIGSMLAAGLAAGDLLNTYKKEGYTFGEVFFTWVLFCVLYTPFSWLSVGWLISVYMLREKSS